jgi:hypothetical protein
MRSNRSEARTEIHTCIFSRSLHDVLPQENKTVLVAPNFCSQAAADTYPSIASITSLNAAAPYHFQSNAEGVERTPSFALLHFLSRHPLSSCILYSHVESALNASFPSKLEEWRVKLTSPGIHQRYRGSKQEKQRQELSKTPTIIFLLALV